jgi:hypothetical protein
MTGRGLAPPVEVATPHRREQCRSAALALAGFTIAAASLGLAAGIP